MVEQKAVQTRENMMVARFEREARQRNESLIESNKQEYPIILKENRLKLLAIEKNSVATREKMMIDRLGRESTSRELQKLATLKVISQAKRAIENQRMILLSKISSENIKQSDTPREKSLKTSTKMQKPYFCDEISVPKGVSSIAKENDILKQQSVQALLTEQNPVQLQAPFDLLRQEELEKQAIIQEEKIKQLELETQRVIENLSTERDEIKNQLNQMLERILSEVNVRKVSAQVRFAELQEEQRRQQAKADENKRLEQLELEKQRAAQNLLSNQKDVKTRESMMVARFKRKAKHAEALRQEEVRKQAIIDAEKRKQIELERQRQVEALITEKTNIEERINEMISRIEHELHIKLAAAQSWLDELHEEKLRQQAAADEDERLNQAELEKERVAESLRVEQKAVQTRENMMVARFEYEARVRKVIDVEALELCLEEFCSQYGENCDNLSIEKKYVQLRENMMKARYANEEALSFSKNQRYNLDERLSFQDEAVEVSIEEDLMDEGDKELAISKTIKKGEDLVFPKESNNESAARKRKKKKPFFFVNVRYENINTTTD